MKPSLVVRGSTFYLRKRVPRRYQPVEPREYLLISLHTDSKVVAEAKAQKVWTDHVEAWEAALDGEAAEAEDRLASAKNLAAKRGFRFMTAPEVARLPVDQILERVEAVNIGKGGHPRREEAEAFLGGATPPELTLSRALKEFWKVASLDQIGKSADQLRRWKAPREKAFKNFIDLVGDKPMQEVTRDDLQAFKTWWFDKIEAEGLTRNSANKDLIHVTSTLKRVALEKSIPLNFHTEKLMFSEKDEHSSRKPIPDGWIKDKILAPGALDGLNSQARGVLLAMINTGCRPSELAMLTAAQIRLSADVPHIVIEPVGRTLKSAYARRSIPLTGVSLAAFEANPNGFPRYANKPGLTDTINKFLRENKLLPAPMSEFSMYGFRHAFEDRLLAAGVDERIRRDLMGHRLTRERYGAGASLAQVRDMLVRIAL